MRKKLLSKTYLRDVKKYNFSFYNDNDDFYLTVKKIIEIDKPFVISNGICIMDKDYYIVEVLPKTENYGMRVYLNKDKEVVEHYFDVSLQNGLDEETKIPFYDDAYLDVIVLDGEIIVDDEDELEEALKQNTISQEDYKLVVKTKDKLVKELKNKTNKYFNMDLKKYLI